MNSTTRRITHLRALIDHPNTPDHERAAAKEALERIRTAQRSTSRSAAAAAPGGIRRGPTALSEDQLASLREASETEGKGRFVNPAIIAESTRVRGARGSDWVCSVVGHYVSPRAASYQELVMVVLAHRAERDLEERGAGQTEQSRPDAVTAGPSGT